MATLIRLSLFLHIPMAFLTIFANTKNSSLVKVSLIQNISIVVFVTVLIAGFIYYLSVKILKGKYFAKNIYLIYFVLSLYFAKDVIISLPTDFPGALFLCLQLGLQGAAAYFLLIDPATKYAFKNSIANPIGDANPLGSWSWLSFCKTEEVNSMPISLIANANESLKSQKGYATNLSSVLLLSLIPILNANILLLQLIPVFFIWMMRSKKASLFLILVLVGKYVFQFNLTTRLEIIFFELWFIKKEFSDILNRLGDQKFFKSRIEKNKGRELLISEEFLLISTGELYRDPGFKRILSESHMLKNKLLDQINVTQADYIALKFSECLSFKFSFDGLTIDAKNSKCDSFKIDLCKTNWDIGIEKIIADLEKKIPNSTTDPEFIFLNFSSKEQYSKCPACASLLPKSAEKCLDCGLFFK